MVQTENKNAYFKSLQNSLAIFFFPFLISNSRRLNRKQRQRIWFLPERFFFSLLFIETKYSNRHFQDKVQKTRRREGAGELPVWLVWGGVSLSGAAAGPETTLQVLAAAGRV